MDAVNIINPSNRYRMKKQEIVTLSCDCVKDVERHLENVIEQGFTIDCFQFTTGRLVIVYSISNAK